MIEEHEAALHSLMIEEHEAALHSFPAEPQPDMALAEGSAALQRELDTMPNIRPALRDVLRRMVVDHAKYGPLYSAILQQYNAVVDAQGSLGKVEGVSSPVHIEHVGPFCPSVPDDLEPSDRLSNVVTDDIQSVVLGNKVLRMQVQEILRENQKLKEKLLENGINPESKQQKQIQLKASTAVTLRKPTSPVT